MSRFLHTFLAACYFMAAVCVALVANRSSTGVASLLWILNVPVIMTAAYAARLGALSDPDPSS